jgi:hypothetical protein
MSTVQCEDAVATLMAKLADDTAVAGAAPAAAAPHDEDKFVMLLTNFRDMKEDDVDDDLE